MDCRPWPHSHQLIRFGMIWSPRLGCKRLKSRSIGSIFLNHINLSDLSKTGETSQGQLIEFDEEKSEWTIATFSADIVHFQDQWLFDTLAFEKRLPILWIYPVFLQHFSIAQGRCSGVLHQADVSFGFRSRMISFKWCFGMWRGKLWKTPLSSLEYKAVNRWRLARLWHHTWTSVGALASQAFNATNQQSLAGCFCEPAP